MITLSVNSKKFDVDADGDTPLLWVLREELRLTGTKFGCGMALCGACTVHLDGVAIRACVTPLAAADGRSVTTIEGLGKGKLHPVQRAWLELDVPQCGYCQSGQIMAAAALLRVKPDADAQDVDDAMSGNLCRCGTYCAIRRGITRAQELLRAEQK